MMLKDASMKLCGISLFCWWEFFMEVWFFNIMQFVNVMSNDFVYVCFLFCVQRQIYMNYKRLDRIIFFMYFSQGMNDGKCNRFYLFLFVWDYVYSFVYAVGYLFLILFSWIFLSSLKQFSVKKLLILASKSIFCLITD